MRRTPLLALVLMASFLAALGVAIFFETATASPVKRFVSAGGAGASCIQAAPCALQTALGQALDGDTLYVGAGTFTGAGGAVVTLTKSITLYGGWDGAPAGAIVRNASVHISRIDAQNLRRGVYISGDITPTLDGFTVMRGNASGQVAGCTASSAGGCGGGVYAYQSHPRISNNVIISNTALITSAVYAQGHGGGIFLQSTSSAVISSNLVFNNVANIALHSSQGEGGGIQIEGSGSGVFIQANQIISNAAPTWGGGIAIGGGATPSVNRNFILNNDALSGAGLYQWFAGGSILSNYASGNRSGDAAVYLGYSTALLASNTIVSNSTQSGVALVNGDGSPVRLVNNIIALNGDTGIRAEGYAGGGPLTATLLFNTLVGPGYGRALYVPLGTASQVLMTNTLIAGFGFAFYNDGTPTSTIYARNTLLDGNIIEGIGVVNTLLHGAAAFINPAANDYHIGTTSAARNAGISTGVLVDIDNNIRPIGPATDIGADETIYDNALFLPLITR